MQQLSGLDAVFLHLESANMPMHIGSLAIYDPSTAPDGHVGFKDILAYFAQRLHKARSFRQRLARVPLSADHPFWVEDPDFDLEYHVRHIALPKPGDWRQLCIQTARLHSRPLDMERPLWEATVIEGLDNVDGVPPGSFALVTKFHHAAVDGVSATEIAAAFHDVAADAFAEPPAKPWKPDRLPGDLELLGRAAMSTVRKPLEMASFAAKSAPKLLRAGSAALRGEASWKVRVPRTRFNETVSSHRVFDARQYPLDAIKAIKSTVEGATVNDVVVSVCGGALREYLHSKGELPKESLVAMAPVSARSQDQRGTAGNRISTLSLPIRTDVADPYERLKAVHEESQRAKKMSGSLGGDIVADIAHFLPSMSSGLMAHAYGRWDMARRLPPVFNTVITNVPGPGFPLYSMGSQLVANYGLGPVAHGVGLFQPVLSYNGNVTISAVSCREIMPDPAFYCECLDNAFAELGRAVKSKAKSTGKAAQTPSVKPMSRARARAAERKRKAALTKAESEGTVEKKKTSRKKRAVSKKAPDKKT
ncbi:MAG: wax ester/triacylglycerol synthase family O-acyltransferase [Gammaproteobacteria bacterium]